MISKLIDHHLTCSHGIQSMAASPKRPIRALFQKQILCDRCQDPCQIAIQCACLRVYCDACLSAIIHEWVLSQSPDLLPPPEVDHVDLPPTVISNLRFRALTTRVRECGICFHRTLCPRCAISGYFQWCPGCYLPPHTGVCPRCVAAGALIASPGVPEPAWINPFSSPPPVLWRCPRHKYL